MILLLLLLFLLLLFLLFLFILLFLPLIPDRGAANPQGREKKGRAMPARAVRKVDPDVLEGFLEEAQGYLPQIRAGIAALAHLEAEAGLPAGAHAGVRVHLEVLEEAHRQVHCIKGAASMVGLPGLSGMAARLEEALEERVATGTPLASHEPPLLGQIVDLIEFYLDSARKGLLDEDFLVQQAEELFLRLKDPDGEQNAARTGSLPGDTAAEEIDPELLVTFGHETEDHLRTINRLLPALLETPANREALQDIRRSVHTLKGSAAMIGLPEVTRLLHRMEDLLDLLYAGRRPITPDATALLVTATDALEELAAGTAPTTLEGLYQCFERLLAGIREPEEEPALPLPAQITAIPGAPPTLGSEVPPRIDKYVRVPLERLDDLTRLVSELVIARTGLEQRLTRCLGQIEELQRGTERLERSARDLETRYEVPALAHSNSELGTRSAERLFTPRSALRVPSSNEFDDLELDRYTPFHQLSRALTETTADLASVASELGKLTGELETGLSQQAQLSSEIQDRLTRLRLVPLSHLSGRLQRTVRGVARAQKKDVHLILEGENTELDKLVLEELAEPLLHLLRNAVDHGIEPAEKRRERGKSETGTIRIRARQESNRVVLDVSDDGGGIDPEAVRRTALANLPCQGESGCLGAEIQHLSEEELLALVFQPGFSTARRVSEVSGRGVGLDVVKSRVERLNGTVRVSSRLGEGTTFTIRLPVQLALMKALLVRSAGQTFAVPLAAIAQIGRLHVDAEEVEPGTIQLGELQAPRVDLAEALSLPRNSQCAPADRSACASQLVDRPPVLMVHSAGRHLALVVDYLVARSGDRATTEVVVKALGNQPRRVPGVAGATVLGNGSVILILNPDDLDEGKRPAPRPQPLSPAARGEKRPPSGGLTILIVDDSTSVRRVMTRLLTGIGWKVLAARDGLEALELLHRTGPLPDLMLVDVEMPRMGGYELLASVKGDPALAHVPAVMVTSRSTAKHRRKAEEVGASDFVVKPYQDEQLLGIIRRVVN